MKTPVLALFGSPRRGGNTDMLMEELLSGVGRDGGTEITRLYLSEMDIKPCTGCGYCEANGVCCIQDEMQKIYSLLEEAHIIAVSSPVYFYGISAQCKAMIDRTHVYWARKCRQKRSWSRDDDIIRQGFFLAAAGTDNPNLFYGGELTIRYFFEHLDVVYQGAVMVKNVQEKGEVRKNLADLKMAYNKGVELTNPY
jgi:hypothetical protein